MRRGITRICARRNTRRSGSGWRQPAWGCASRNISAGFANWKARRPSIGGDRRRFDEVRSYREAVARLSLATAAAIALNAEGSEADIQAAHGDSDVDTLFRIVMQCQIIDDVMDYAEDLSAGLPSFLTASASLPQAMALTARAARSYGASPAAFIRHRRVSAAHGAVCRHGGDEPRRSCCRSPAPARATIRALARSLVQVVHR